MRRAQVLALCLFLIVPAFLQAQADEARIPIRVLGGRIVARCQVSSPRKTIPVNLFIAFDRLCSLELHNKATDPLGVEHEDGSFDPITIQFRGMDIAVDQREHGDEEDMETFTRRFAPQIDEVACVGTIGAKILSQYLVTCDLNDGIITLIRPQATERPDLPTGPEDFYLPASMAGDMLWFPVKLADGQSRMMALGGSSVDSVIDEVFCEERGAMNGRVGAIHLGELNLSESIAWRPEEFNFVHPGGALATLGLGFLEDHRVVADPVNGWVGFSQIRKRSFPQEAEDFFQARSEMEVEPLRAWLDQYGETRLAREASELLLQMVLDEGGAIADLEVAVNWVHKTRDEDMRATEAIKTVSALRSGHRDDAAVLAAELGIADGRKDRYPESVHRLHAILGEIYLAENRDREAWEHLMSAAFGLSEAVGNADRSQVDLMLGEYYERQGRLSRAMSRYVQAVVTPEAGPQAVAAIERVQARMGGESFSVALVEKLISGKIRGMTAPNKFEETEATKSSNRVVLLEHLSNPHFGRKKAENWLALAEGGGMVFEAMATHFPRERLVVISYHGDQPQPVATMNAQSMMAAERMGGKMAFAVNGQVVAPGGLPYFETDKLYDALRDHVVEQIAVPSPYDLQVHAELKEGKVTGLVQIDGPESRDLRLEVVLVEDAVLYPGLGGAVVHRMLSRGHLSERVAGEIVRASNLVRITNFERSLDEIEAENRKYLEDYEKSGGSSATRLSLKMDRDALGVVVILRSASASQVLQSAYFNLKPEAKGESRE